MRKIRITPEGLTLFERVMRSCPPRASNGGQETKRLLYNLANEKKDLNVGEFLKKLNVMDLSGTVFGHFFGIAEKLGVNEIDEQFVVEYFSGEFHSAEIIRKVDEGAIDVDMDLMKKIEPLYKWFVIVSHLLMPAYLLGFSETGFIVRYQNGERNFNIKNLIPFSGDFLVFEKETLVWTHLSSIIGKADEKLAKIALESQKKNEFFQEAYRKVSRNGINAEALIAYHVWAKKAHNLF